MSETEPCPHCNGSGERLKAPPVGQHGGPRKKGQRTHGIGLYQAGCRCDLCRAAWREAARRYRSKAKSA